MAGGEQAGGEVWRGGDNGFEVCSSLRRQLGKT